MVTLSVFLRKARDAIRGNSVKHNKRVKLLFVFSLMFFKVFESLVSVAATRCGIVRRKRVEMAALASSYRKTDDLITVLCPGGYLNYFRLNRK